MQRGLVPLLCTGEIFWYDIKKKNTRGGAITSRLAREWSCVRFLQKKTREEANLWVRLTVRKWRGESPMDIVLNL